MDAIQLEKPQGAAEALEPAGRVLRWNDPHRKGVPTCKRTETSLDARNATTGTSRVLDEGLAKSERGSGGDGD